MFSLPRPRTSEAARCNSSSVLCGLASRPIADAPCVALISSRPLATYSSAVCQSTSCQVPPCFNMGLVSRSSPFSAS